MLTPDALLNALAIFILRVVNMSISTLSTISILRQRRWLTFTLVFLETLVWAVVVANVINDLGNWLNLLAYCGGLGVGSYTGLMLEERLIASFATAIITVSSGGHDLALRLRARGYGVTETIGDGRDGRVTLLHVVVPRKRLPVLLAVVDELNPRTFVSVDEVSAVQGGALLNGPS